MIKDLVKRLIGPRAISLMLSLYRERFILMKDYKNKTDEMPYFRGIIFMSDGKLSHGGLSDRLRGLVSLFIYCRNENIPFAVNYVSPFRLEDYLVPNEYNWLIEDSNLVYDNRISRPVIISPYSSSDNIDTSQYFSDRLRKVRKYIQLHVYSNTTLSKDQFGQAFNILFKPSQKLQKVIDDTYRRIGSNYVSITFRFQQLLGDFKEGNYKVLDLEKRNELMMMCSRAVDYTKRENPQVDTVLVTSDSVTYLEFISNMYPYVAIIPGVVIHMDYTFSNAEMAYIKSFVDLYMISKAQKVYSYVTGDMYKNSAFAETAALIGGIPFSKISNKDINL